jgi:hypothetical protein
MSEINFLSKIAVTEKLKGKGKGKAAPLQA